MTTQHVHKEIFFDCISHDNNKFFIRMEAINVPKSIYTKFSELLFCQQNAY